MRFGGVSVSLDEWEREDSLAPVLRGGRNGLSWAALGGGVEVYLGREVEGIAPFARQGRVALAIGEPFCAAELSQALMGEFKGWCRRRDLVAAAFPVGEDLATAMRASGFEAVTAGLEPCIDLTREDRPEMGRRLRHAVAAGHQGGLTIHQVVPSTIDFDGLLAEILGVRDAWLEAKEQPLDRYVFEMHPGDGTERKRFFLARLQGKPAAYLSCVPSRLGARWTVATLARTPDAPPGTSEALLTGAVQVLSEMGVEELSLGAVVLAGVDPDPEGALPGLRARMRRLYSHPPGPVHNPNLLSFKKKFHPDWMEPALVAVQAEGLDEVVEADLVTLLAGEHAGSVEPDPGEGGVR